MRWGLLAAALAVAACQEDAPPQAEREPEPEVQEEQVQVPQGAVQIGEEVYAVPLDYVDDDGCRPWRLWSPTKMVVQALQYRRPDGSFTLNKLDAACMQEGAQ